MEKMEEMDNVFPLNKESKIKGELDNLEMELVALEEKKVALENAIEAKKAELESITPDKSDEELAA